MSNKIEIRKDILLDPHNSLRLGIVISNTGVTSNEDGEKIIKAGTPITGSLEARTTAWKVASVSDTPNAVILHDTKVTKGNSNAVAVITGTIDIDKLDDSVITMLTDTVKSNLSKLTFTSGRN